jgi:glycosyltransferase involved in cell wall biosynthesis
LSALRATGGQHEFIETAFSDADRQSRNPFRRYNTSLALSLVGNYRHKPTHLFGHDFHLFHALDHYIPALQVPVVATVHDALWFSNPQYLPRRFRKLKAFLFRRKCLLADQVITVSQFSAHEIIRYLGIDERRLTVIYEGVAPHILREAELPPRWNALEQDFRLRPGYVVFCGAISPKKNIDRLLDAYLDLPAKLRREHQLVLIGDEYSTGVGGDTPRRLRDLEREGIVRWLGRQEAPDMARVLRHATLFAFPSLHEGFGLPVVEAFHLGLPVLTSNRAALPEIAGNAALTVDPEDVADIARGLHALLSDERARAELSEKARARAALFDWRRCAKETLRVYSALD